MAYRREQAEQYLGRELLRDGTGGDRIDYDGELHRMTVGAPGVGKTLRLLAPNLLTVFGKSMVVIDPKGQLAAITACYRKEQGDDVYVIDPFGVLDGFCEKFPAPFRKLRSYGLTETWGFDPLAGLRPRSMADRSGLPEPGSKTYFEDVAGLAEALVRIDADAREPHWPQSARQLVTGLIMWEIEREKVPGEIASLAHVYELLTEPDQFTMMSRTEEVWDDNLQRYVEKEIVWRQQTAGLRLTIKKMATSDSRQMRSLASRFDTDQPSDEIQSIKSNANTHLAWLLSDAIADNLSMPPERCVDFNRIKQRPTTVYIVLEPGYIESHSVWLRLFINAVFRAARKTHGPHDILLMIDEFPVLGFLEVIQSQWTVCRDYNLQLWIAMQDMTQLQRLYPGSWSSIISGCGVKQFFRTDDFVTADWVRDRSPPTTVVEYSWTQNHNPDGTPSGSLQERQVKQDLFQRNWLFSLREDCVVTYFAGVDEYAFLFVPHLFKDMPGLREKIQPNPYRLMEDRSLPGSRMRPLSV